MNNLPETELERLRAENEKLKGFALDVLNTWNEDGLSGPELIELCVKSGIMEPVTMTAFCGGYCSCADWYDDDDLPITCYRRTDLVKASGAK